MNDLKEALNELAIKVLQGEEPPEAFRDQARAIKWGYLDLIQAAYRDVAFLDSLVQRYAYDPSWGYGFTPEEYSARLGLPTPAVIATTATAPGAPALPQPRPTPNRRDRALQIAAQMVRDGATTVVSQQIAERLRAEGDTGISLKDLSTAVGNTLARTDGWIRVSPGQYRLAPQGPYEKQAGHDSEVRAGETAH